MKAERRQELRTNELAQMLEQARQVMRTWGSYIVGGVVVVVLVIAFVAYRAAAADQALSDAWQNLREMQGKYFFTQTSEKRTDAEIATGFEGLQRVADAAKTPDLAFEALANQAQIAMQLSGMTPGGVDANYLDRAEQAYNALKIRMPDNPLAVALALDGAARIEADRFVLDADPAHKDKARRFLEQLRDDPRFAHTPFQTAALAHLNRLDDMFREVKLAPAPVPVTLTPLEGPPAPEGPAASAPSSDVQIRKLPGPPPGVKPIQIGKEPKPAAEPGPAPPPPASEPKADQQSSESSERPE
jgi:hypothetical protein